MGKRKQVCFYLPFALPSIFTDISIFQTPECASRLDKIEALVRKLSSRLEEAEAKANDSQVMEQAVEMS